MTAHVTCPLLFTAGPISNYAQTWILPCVASALLQSPTTVSLHIAAWSLQGAFQRWLFGSASLVLSGNGNVLRVFSGSGVAFEGLLWLFVLSFFSMRLGDVGRVLDRVGQLSKVL